MSQRSRPPSRLYEYNRRESSSYYKVENTVLQNIPGPGVAIAHGFFQPMLNMLDAREVERASSISSNKSSMLGEEEVLVTEEEVGDFLVHCYAQKEKEANLAIGNKCKDEIHPT